MKFRNLKAGEVFSVSGMMDDWCGEHCKGLSCPINNLAEKVEMSGRECEKWIITHPHEAAHLMGYEVIATDCDQSQREEANMEAKHAQTNAWEDLV